MIVNMVMLTTAQRPRLTDQAIKTLTRNTPKDIYNITIVNDGELSGIWTEAAMRDHAVMLTINPSKGITGLVRNLGVYLAEKYWGRGDYLYLSDNDAYFTPGWLARLITVFEETKRKVTLLGGWNHPYMQPKETDGYVRTHDAVAGASQLMRWETFDKYGPLDAHAVGVCQGEDWQFCQNIIKDGGRVGSIYPRVVFNCGLTNSHGQPSVGSDVVLKELQEAKRTYADLHWE